MLKTVGKEIVIMLLLSVAIILILGILFYDYIPINKVVPTREAYTTPDNIKNEISEDITEAEKVEVTYEVTDSDLNVYQQGGRYTEGKANPFALPEEEQTNTANNNGTNNNNNNNSNNGNNNSNDNNKNNDNNNDSNTNNDNNDTEKDTEANKNSTGTFFDDEGIK